MNGWQMNDKQDQTLSNINEREREEICVGIESIVIQPSKL